MKIKKPILSLCIPTYNRADILRNNLEIISKQLNENRTNEVEIIVSDNCSPDNTQEVVANMQKLGLPIEYNRNAENIGADGNFLKSMNIASGKYVYLLGDDDFFAPNAIGRLLEILRDHDYGLVYIDTRNNHDGNVIEFHNQTKFIKEVSYFYTFMSGCVFRRDAIDKVRNHDKYIATHLLQMPFYLQSTMMSDSNVVVRFPILGETGADAQNNGGYNFFEVFVQNYLTIMAEYIKDACLYAWLKKDIWSFVWAFTLRLLIRKDKGNFKTENGWRILLKYYGIEWYFWWTLFKYPFGVVKRRIKKLL